MKLIVATYNSWIQTGPEDYQSSSCSKLFDKSCSFKDVYDWLNEINADSNDINRVVFTEVESEN